MPVPNTDTFSLQDVVDEVVPYVDTLDDCFTDALAAKFDPRYEGDKDNLLNFRNYGYSKSIGAESDTLPIDANCKFLDGTPDTEWFFGVRHRDSSGSREDTLEAYRCQSDGNLTRSLLIYTINKEVTDFLVVSEDVILVTYRWNVGSDYYFRLESFSFDLTNGFTLNDYVEYQTTGTYGDSRIAYWNGYVYLLLHNVSEGYTRRIEHFAINTSTGEFGGVGTFLTLSSGTVYDIYCQDGHLFLSLGPTTAYLYAYSLDSSDGDPTYVTLVATTYIFTNIDGNKDNIIYGGHTNGTSIVSFNGTTLTLEDYQAITGGSLKVSFSELNGGYHTVSSDYYILQRVDSNNDIVASDSQALEEDVTGGAAEEVFDVENCFCNLKYSYGVAAGFYDGLFNEYYYLFSYPIT